MTGYEAFNTARKELCNDNELLHALICYMSPAEAERAARLLVADYDLRHTRDQMRG